MSFVWVAVGSAAVKGVGDHIQGNIQKDTAIRAGEATSAGFDEAKDTIAKGKEETLGKLGEAKGLYDPYADLGKDALSQYQNLLSGEGVSSIYDDPAFQQIQAQTEKAIGQQAAASGKSRSGVALSNYYAPAMSNLAYKGYYDKLNSLQTPLQYGYGATGAQANITGQEAQTGSDYYSNLAKLQLGQGGAGAETIQQMGNADVMRWAGPVQAIGQGLEQYAGYRGYNQTPPAPKTNYGRSVYATT